MLALIHKLFGSKSSRIIDKLKNTVTEINTFEPKIKALSDQGLKAKTNEFKGRLKHGSTLEALLPEAFAVVREASFRSLQMRHFDVQLIGGIILHQGLIAEMKTGEGKTLVSTLAAYLNSLTGEGVHIVTVNDYLAKRDSAWMGRIYKALGVSVGCITGDIAEESRKAAYLCDITYATNNELGFDYLRDNMRFDSEEMVQRKLNFAIIDEVDSILIDKARTPLIISGPTEQNVQVYNRISRLIGKILETDLILDEKNRNIILTEEGQEHVEELLLNAGLLRENSSLYDMENLNIVHHLDQSLKAHKLFHKDKDYIVSNGKIIIIDEFTGRMMEGRRFSDGLHQGLEAKENVKIENENQTLASITFQNYFRMYKKLAGMTGTAATEAEELSHIYNLEVVQIPTHMPVKRVDEEDEIYATEEEKFKAIIALVKQCHEKQQPLLIGTVNISNSEKLSYELKKHKLRHSVLNAKYHEQEAEIIAQAGRPGSITIATNMAGRGTDIKLGGNYDLLKEKISLQQFEEDQKIVIEAGGLYVLGTERHESRRIDNQLRGRSGRQGDPGKSKFFLSLEDDLLRIFGSGRIKTILQKLGLKDNEAIFHPWISRALEKAQKKVENRNYEIRKTLIKFDDVINDQRKIVFSERNSIIGKSTEALLKERNAREDYNFLIISEEINTQLLEAAKLRNFYDTEKLQTEISAIYNIELEGLEKIDNIEEYIQEKTSQIIKEKEASYPTEEILTEIKKRIMLSTLDQLWKEHLHFLDHLRVTVNLRAIGQKNPLNEFKHEAFYAFQNLLHKWNEIVINTFLKINITRR